MKTDIDMNALLQPIPGDSPAGEDLRYAPVYEEIREARRSEDPLAMGDWQRELKTADWSRVVSLATEALTSRTKDLQIAAWLCEALVMTGGFGALFQGLALVTGLQERFWDTVYPLIEDGDLEYRLAPFEFLNDKLSAAIRSAPLNDPASTLVCSLNSWNESREAGYEADTKNRYGDVDEQKKQRRDELIAEGKMTAEAFDAAAAQSSPSCRIALLENLARCREAFRELDRVADERFGREAPRLSDIGEALDECDRLVSRLYREEKEQAAAPVPAPSAEPVAAGTEEEAPGEAGEPVPFLAEPEPEVRQSSPIPSLAPCRPPVARVEAPSEQALWEEALRVLEGGGMKKALEQLLAASCASPSERERNRYRLLMGKLCLRAGRPDLARPILEGLSALIDELHLERWESPLWIAEVLEALYQCLMSGEPSADDQGRGAELFRRLCSLDVTKAILYRK
jgi:type VI secretion system protein ImpA